MMEAAGAPSWGGGGDNQDQQQLCLALCCYVYVENIGFVNPAMSMMVIGPSLLY
jgi:hypothetical protein